MIVPDYDGAPRKKERVVSPVLWAGLAVLVVGVGPLVAIMIAAALGLTSDPNPNPIGPGILAFLLFWPGVALTVVGVVLSTIRWRRRRDSADERSAR